MRCVLVLISLTDEEPETQRGSATCPGTHSRQVAERRCEPRQSDPRAHAPNHRAVLAWCGVGAQWMPAAQMNERIETGAGGRMGC